MGTRAAACKYNLVSQQEKISSKFSKMASQKNHYREDFSPGRAVPDMDTRNLHSDA